MSELEASAVRALAGAEARAATYLARLGRMQARVDAAVRAGRARGEGAWEGEKVECRATRAVEWGVGPSGH